MKQLRIADIAGEYSGMHFVVYGNVSGVSSCWQPAPACSGTSVPVYTVPVTAEPSFFCTVKEAVSSLFFVAESVTTEFFRQTIPDQLKRIAGRLRAAFRFSGWRIRFCSKRQGLYRESGGLRL